MNDPSREDRCSVALPGHAPPPWEFLSEIGAALDLCAIGVAPAGPLPAAAAAAYEDFLASGRHAGLGYAERWREVRADLRHPGILEGATAIVCAALPYGDGATRAGIFRHVAAHARGRDYHETMRDKLGRVAAEISARFPGARCRVFVDTAPISERTWARLAGLGAIGASGALIVPGVGPRVVLGEVVCAGPPPPSPRTYDEAHCTSCGACVRACPTGAIVAPSAVDCRRCLSFHTIEDRAPELPEWIAGRVSLVFGCDACTDACPRNATARRSALELPPSAPSAEVDLGDLAALGERELAGMIAGTCLARTGPGAISRNARCALSRGGGRAN